ncbi:MAG: aspartyl protease family protein [Methylocystis sp.]|uniref:aspartyl protease family protein n=1 Tax=Methylocystis sp. TaxID=1911079 RepID=UPI003DA2AA9A
MRRLLCAFLFLATGTEAALCESLPSTVPLTLTQSDYDGGRIYVPVRFGNAMGTMRLDTGASTSRVGLAPWNKDLPKIGESRSTAASGEAAVCEDVEARNVQLRASQGPGVARNSYELTRCARNDGDDLLGLDFFRRARFSLDLDRREMELFDKVPPESRLAPFRLLGPDQRLIGLPLRLGNVTSVGLFDTGAELSAVDQSFVDAHKGLFTPVKNRLRASAADGGKISSRVYRVKQVALPDGHVVKNLYALAYDFGPLRQALGRQVAIILGYNFLRKFAWEIDLTTPASPRWSATPRK